MDASMWVAKTGLDAQQTRMNVISNNLANVNTTGFKRDRAVFEDLLYQNIRQAGGQTSTNTQAPTGLLTHTQRCDPTAQRGEPQRRRLAGARKIDDGALRRIERKDRHGRRLAQLDGDLSRLRTLCDADRT